MEDSHRLQILQHFASFLRFPLRYTIEMMRNIANEGRKRRNERIPTEIP